MGIIIRKIRLCFNDESYDGFIRPYDKHTDTCHAMYNWAVCGYTEDDCYSYVQKDGRSYMDRANRKMCRQVANQAGAWYILNPLVFRRYEFMFFDDLCTIICEVVYVRSEFPSLGCLQTTRQPVQTWHNDWIKLFIITAHNGINKQKPIITRSFF